MSIPLLSTAVNSTLTNLVVQANNPQSYLSTIPKDLVIYWLADRTIDPDNFISEMCDLKNNHSSNPIAVKVANYLHQKLNDSDKVGLFSLIANNYIHSYNFLKYV